jgi:uncharacterized protein YutE (UPF0331/DUF86 family)
LQAWLSVHRYEEIDVEQVASAAARAPEDFRSYVTAVARFVQQYGS